METITIQRILSTIDKSQMRPASGMYDICSSEFDIHEFIRQPEGAERLTYCYYISWTCTDTEVGVRVWYFDGKPVCISWQMYRKADEVFNWLSPGDFHIVKNYALSLVKDWSSPTILDDETISEVIKQCWEVEYKQFEKHNYETRTN